MILMMKHVHMLHMNMYLCSCDMRIKFIDKFGERFMRYIYILRIRLGSAPLQLYLQHGHLQGVSPLCSAVPAQEYHHCLAAY